ncbi:unnamed protein product [Phytophthora fragariaefolia]|uniref:Unnamed protein product n=1 Tax=Phytophthora fragariaefolia TaxID=1490495 RepID=A0A9W6YD92_9STRA|nr:unnamed protein product [Phytophthora fragariaefolia]
MIGVLTKAYGDETVAKMLEQAKRNPNTEQFATELQNEQILAWALNGLTTDDVFTMLKLHDGGIEKLLTNPALEVWYNFFNFLNHYNPDKDVHMITKVIGTYDDISLAKAIMAAKEDDAVQPVVLSLQRAQFQNWKRDGKAPAGIMEMTDDPGIVHVYKAYLFRSPQVAFGN